MDWYNRKIIWWLCHAGVEGDSKRTTSLCHAERSEASTQDATPVQAIAEASII
jgi:hypothetical protein